MSTAAPATARVNSLALAFQDVVTVVLRMRYGAQRVADAAGFRANIRKMIAGAVQEVRSLGYTDAAGKMALYAIVGFLDESVLNSGDPTFADWARRPLQEEMFQGHFAGEVFFQQVADLLNAPESTEVADALELHALCLLLGYRGKYAFGDHGEIHGILSRIRDKILRIRGPLAIARLSSVPEIQFKQKPDKLLTTLWIAAAALALLTIAAFALYTLTLGANLTTLQSATLLALPAISLRKTHPKSVILSEVEGPAVSLAIARPLQPHQNPSHPERSAAQSKDLRFRVPHPSRLCEGWDQPTTTATGCPTLTTVSSPLGWAGPPQPSTDTTTRRPA